MLRITITEDAETTDDMVVLLEHITGMVAEGYTSGYHPHWTLLGDPEPVEDDE